MKKHTVLLHVATFALCLLFVGTPARADEGFALDMRGADIREFINTVAKLTDKTIIVDERVKGTVNIQSHRDLAPDELYEIFLLQLGVSGFAVVDMGNGILKVIPNQAAKIEGIEVQTEGSSPQQSEAIITRIVQVQNVDVDKLVPSLRPLVDNRTGVITPYSASNVILITDRESNVRRLLSIIQQVDRADSQSMETVELRNASARELEGILNKLISEQSKEQGSPKPLISSDLRTNTLILYGNTNERTFLRKLIKELDNDVQSSANIRVHYLKYARAKDMVAVLQSVSEAMIKEDEQTQGQGGKSRRNINIEAHEQTNSVVLSGSPDIIRNLEEVIRNLDIRRAQVMVEAIIIEMTETRAKELGVQWLFQGDRSGTRPVGGIGYPSASPNAFTVGAAIANGGDSVAAALSGLQGVALGVGKITETGFSFGALVTALASDSESNILSTPSLVTMDNQEASILVGSEVPFITGSTASANNTNPFQTISREEVGTKLTVTPQINEGDAVQLTIAQEVSSISGLTASDIITNKRTINTSVLVNDGATIVLGGLIDDDIQEITDKVPILGDMPIIGHLFRADRTQKSKRNLMTFIRPTIIRDQATMSSLSGEKYNYIRAQQKIMHQGGINLFPEVEAPVMPAWTGLDPSPAGMLPEDNAAAGDADEQTPAVDDVTE